MHYDILGGMTFFPGLGILILFAWRRLDEEWAFRIALTASVTPWAFLIRILSLYRTSPGGIQFGGRSSWLPQFLGEGHTGLDGFSVGLLLSASILIPLAIWTAWQNRDRAGLNGTIRAHLRLILLAQMALYGALTSLNLLHAFTFWEILIVSTFLLLEHPRDERTNLAARQFLLQAVAGGVMVLAGLQLLQVATGSWDQTTLARMAHQDTGSGGQSALAIRLQEIAVRLNAPWLSPSASTLVFALIAGGLLIQMPVWPFHGWLPTTATRSSAPSAILLMGMVVPTSLYFLVRLVLPLFGNLVVKHHGVLLALASITVATSSLAALAQENLRKSGAYASLVGTGIGLIGMVAAAMPGGLPNDRAMALNGTLVLMFAQGLGISGLLHLAGRMENRMRPPTASGTDERCGASPGRCGWTGITLLALLGLPGFAGFVGLLMIFRGSLLVATDATVVAVVGLALTSVALFRPATRMLTAVQGRPSGPTIEAGLDTEVAGAVITAILLGIGIFPNSLVALTNATVVKFLGGP